jgi:beta-glucosidase
LFPFGHGLSYTEFELSGLSVETTTAGVRASLTIRNAGHRAGSEVIQVYVGQPVCSVERPTRELKEFAKVFLEPGSSTRVEFNLPRAAFAFWSDAKNDWALEPGEFLIEAGVSSRRIILKRRINLE